VWSRMEFCRYGSFCQTLGARIRASVRLSRIAMTGEGSTGGRRYSRLCLAKLSCPSSFLDHCIEDPAGEAPRRNHCLHRSGSEPPHRFRNWDDGRLRLASSDDHPANRGPSHAASHRLHHGNPGVHRSSRFPTSSDARRGQRNTSPRSVAPGIACRARDSPVRRRASRAGTSGLFPRRRDTEVDASHSHHRHRNSNSVFDGNRNDDIAYSHSHSRGYGHLDCHTNTAPPHS
jgi:hypothetical protein